MGGIIVLFFPKFYVNINIKLLFTMDYWLFLSLWAYRETGKASQRKNGGKSRESYHDSDVQNRTFVCEEFLNKKLCLQVVCYECCRPLIRMHWERFSRILVYAQLIEDISIKSTLFSFIDFFLLNYQCHDFNHETKVILKQYVQIDKRQTHKQIIPNLSRKACMFDHSTLH